MKWVVIAATLALSGGLDYSGGPDVYWLESCQATFPRRACLNYYETWRVRDARSAAGDIDVAPPERLQHEQIRWGPEDGQYLDMLLQNGGRSD